MAKYPWLLRLAGSEPKTKLRAATCNWLSVVREDEHHYTLTASGCQEAT